MERVKFITSGANALVGGFQAGDIMRVSPEMAKHLVDDAQCAERLDGAKKKPAAAPAPDAPTEDEQGAAPAEAEEAAAPAAAKTGKGGKK